MENWIFNEEASRLREIFLENRINKGSYCKCTTNQVSYCKCRSLRSQWGIFRWTACFPSIRLEFLLRKGCQQPASSTIYFLAKIWARSWCCQWGKTPWSHHPSKVELRQLSPKMNGDAGKYHDPQPRIHHGKEEKSCAWWCKIRLPWSSSSPIQNGHVITRIRSLTKQHGLHPWRNC